MKNHPSEHGTILGRELWPALLAGARVTVAEHAEGGKCNSCIDPTHCGRLKMATMYLSDAEMLRVEAEAAEREAKP